MPANLENSAVATGLEKVSFHSNPKERQCQRMLKLFVIHRVKGFGVVNKAKVDVFLELSCFFCDPVEVGNLISGCTAFSKSSLNMWNFMVHKLLKPGLEIFEHYFASMWDECNCVVVWTFFDITFLWPQVKQQGGDTALPINRKLN